MNLCIWGAVVSLKEQRERLRYFFILQITTQMKQIITVIILFSTLQCAAKSFSKRTSVLSIATAVGINDKCKLSSHVPGYVIHDVKQSVPIYIKYEHGVTDDIGIGIYFAHVASKGTFPYAGLIPIAESTQNVN